MSEFAVPSPGKEPIRVLVADDDTDIAETIRFCLEQEGYEVRVASNGYEALGAAHAWHPQVVLLDVMMPRENGYRVSRALKDAVVSNLLPPMSTVLVTARKLDDPEREETFAEFSRADEVLYKPFEMDELIALVDRLAVQACQPA